MNDQIPADLLADEHEIEARALAAHARWKARHRQHTRGWRCAIAGLVAGVGLATLLIAAVWTIR